MKDRNRGVSAQLNSSSNSVITQPVAEAKKLNRNQKQIDALHLEFQDLKKKIKDVESKNQKIIQNIYKNQHNFKKKPHSTQHMMVETTPIVHYQHQLEKFNPDGDYQSQKSEPSDSQFKQSRPIIKKTSNIKKNGSFMNRQSQLYRKTQNYEDKERQKPEIIGYKTSNVLYRPPLPNSNQFTYSANSQYNIPNMPQQQFQVSQFNGLNPFQMSMQLPSYPVSSVGLNQMSSYGQSTYQFQQSLKRQRQKINILQRQLQERQDVISSLKKFEKKYNNLRNNYCQVIQSCFQEFFDETLKKRIYQIQKYVKKNENKLKKLQIKIKDKQEDDRSKRNIEEHRIKRSHSRSKKDLSPKITSNSMSNAPKIPHKKSLLSANDKSVSSPHIQNSSKSKQSQQSKSSHQFELIALQYEQIIKEKNRQIQTFQLRFRQKQKQLIQMNTKCAKLQGKIADLGSQIPKMQKKRKNTEKQENLLANLNIQTQSDIELKILTKRLTQLQDQLSQKTKQNRQKDLLIEKCNKKMAEGQLRSKKIQLQLNKLRQQHKKYEISSQQHQIHYKLKRIQDQLQFKQKQYMVLRQKYQKLQNQKMQKQCQNFTLLNRCKKTQTLLTIKQQKVLQLQKIIQSSAGGQNLGDLLQKSTYIDKIDQLDLQQLQQQKEKLQEQLVNYREEIFIEKKTTQKLQGKLKELYNINEQLKRENQNITLECQSLRLNLKIQQFQKYKPVVQTRSPLQKLLQEQNCLSQQQQDNRRTVQQFEQLKKKYQQLQSSFKNQSHRTFQQNRRVIKLSSELAYIKEHLGQREQKYQKLRKEYQQLKYINNELQHQLKQKQMQLQGERKINGDKIKQIQAQWFEYQQQMRNNEEPINTSQENNYQLSKSRNFSEESFINYRNTYNNINAENERLLEKIKQTQKIIEVQKEMQEKIIVQYRLNIEKIKGQLREKIRQNQNISQQNQNLKRKIRIIEQSQFRLKELAKNNQEQNLLGNSSQKIVQLQMQLQEMRDINSKLTAFQQQLFKQIAQKEFQYQNILKMLNNKEKRIEQLQDIIQLKNMNFQSNISQSNNKSKVRQSIQSQSSLKYSMLSNAQNNRTIQIELSQVGQSCFDQNQSIISNVSEVFGREEFPYEKMQLKRVEQRRLFQKTAAYIKTLKKAIEEKNKRIKLLEKKIQSLRNSQLIRKDIYNVKQNQVFQSDDTQIFKDYYSVQLQTSHSQRYKLKQLEHETKLTIEQNNLLNNQIQSMQEQLLKSQEQQASLMKLKDLYKQQIKSLIKKNQDQTRHFEEQMKKQRTKVQQSQSVQKMQAIKQLFTKIISAFIQIEIDGAKSKKKEERLKQLGDYLKVCTNLLNLQHAVQSKMMNDLKQIKR